MCKKKNYHGTSNTRIDKCIRPLIKFLKDHNWDTVACCCGHGKYPMTVIVRYTLTNGKEPLYQELFTNVIIRRTRNFYRRDRRGYYYIPELED